ncbi:hypothetical protein C2869_01495 [Saccharobesus litoralis]|uniref:DUF2149 domain-containing protein n=1 Tax=Saccharobesus litoralis TaxID=2172099 RepID=A0A2S0VLW3_9ALTE|nr:DUF2149 domain-containing protein [Saccharobesus litoralis]AWB65198.1 hypothetical protein C2869_01495 [Saccharobesus litoralis]
MSKLPWQQSTFAEQDNDPLSVFANIMDIMLVFALGLMLALVANSPELQNKLSIHTQNTQNQNTLDVTSGKELVTPPESMQSLLNGKANGMESIGQVYKDPKTGKLILISGN